MIGLGTLVNTAAILVGGSAGMVIKKGLKESMQNTLTKALGVSVIFIGAAGALSGLLTIQDGKLQTTHTMLMIISMVIGTVLGELLSIEDHMENLGVRLKKLVHVEQDNHFVEGFVNTSLVVCVGAMAIVGSLQDGMNQDATTLLAKSILDGVIAMIFASTLGVGVLFAALPILIYQGGITLLAGLLSPLISAVLIEELTYIGSVLIFIIGLNLVHGKIIKVGNMLPALLVPVFYEILLSLFS